MPQPQPLASPNATFGFFWPRMSSPSAAYITQKRPGPWAEAHHHTKKATYLSASSVIACVQAPTGAAEITGSEPPAKSVATVRS